MRDLSVALFQYDIVWHDWSENQKRLDTLLNTISGHRSDLIILPETFTSGFTLHAQSVAQEMTGPAVNWMLDVASRHSLDIIGSMVILEDECFFNRMICAHSDGSLSYYDKRHLFSYAEENLVFKAGQHRLVFTCGDGWRICPQICYDLRFPVWSRNNEDYDVLVFSANWPSARVNAWDTLLRARAIENQCYTIGVNRVGRDENGIDYPGHSQVCNMGGDVMHLEGDAENVIFYSLSYARLIDYRKQYNFLPDRDRFIIE